MAEAAQCVDEQFVLAAAQRAVAVKNYLISKGIGENRVQAQGKGETQPVTRAGECIGGKSTRLITCLQPDRNVEIEVMGTRTANR